MTQPNYKLERVNITPMRRLRILTNQRTSGFKKAGLITPEFISDMISSYEKQSKLLIRNLLLSSLYLALMYTAYNGSGVKIAILGVDFSDVPRLLEITIGLFSFSLFYIAIQHLNLQILIQAIDSMIGSIMPDDQISQGLVKYRHAPIVNFFFPFLTSLRGGTETIQPVGITKVFNVAMMIIGLAAIFSIYLIPIVFLLGFAVPSLTVGWLSSGIGLLAWICSLFLIFSFLILILKLPYNEELVDNPSENSDN